MEWLRGTTRSKKSQEEEMTSQGVPATASIDGG